MRAGRLAGDFIIRALGLVSIVLGGVGDVELTKWVVIGVRVQSGNGLLQGHCDAAGAV